VTVSADRAGEYVTLARIVKPRGNRGEALARDLCEDPGRFTAGREFRLLYPSGEAKTGRLERGWYHQGRLVLKLEGVDSINDAEELRGVEVQIPYEDLGPPPEGEYYYIDLVGCEVRDADDDRLIGTVEAIQEPGGGMLLEVRRRKRETLIPFRDEVCVEVAPEKKLIRVRLPEGLEELNE